MRRSPPVSRVKCGGWPSGRDSGGQLSKVAPPAGTRRMGVGSPAPPSGWKCTVAQQTIVMFVDDLDSSEASGTVDFALDGRSYEIDLSDENAAKLRDALA